MPFVHHRACDKVPISNFGIMEAKLVLGLILGNELTEFHVPNVIHHAKIVPMKFSSTSLGNFVTNELEILGSPNASV